MSAPPLLQIENLTITRGEGARLVDGLSLELGAGEILALVGESGSGKTLAARSILGLLPHGLTQSEGRIRFDGQDIAQLAPEMLRRLRGQRIGLVLQEPLTALNPAMRIGDQMVEGPMRDGTMRRAAALEAAADMLGRVGIKGGREQLARYPHEFSGGMRQRIMLASVFLTRPELIIADEPTTALDTITQQEVLELMVRLGADFGVAVLLITHNLALASRYAGRVAVMQRGRLVEQGAGSAVLRSPREPYTQALVAAAPRLHDTPPSSVADLSAAPLLEVRDLEVSYTRRGLLGAREGPKALDGVSLTVRPGEFVALVGGSGSGKTTLGRAIMGLVPASAGQIAFEGAVVRPIRDPRFRARTQMIFQDPFSSLNPRQKVGEIVADPLRHEPDLKPADRRNRAAGMLERVGLGDCLDRFPHQLSGGQRQRVAIARALVRSPALVVADEPTSALDVTVQGQVLSLLQEIQRERGFACLFISHDLGVVSRVATRMVILHGGKVVEEGPCGAILAAPRHPHTAALVAATPRF